MDSAEVENRVPYELRAFFRAANRLLSTAYNKSTYVRAGEAMSAVIYQLKDVSFFAPLVLPLLSNNNKFAWYGILSVSTTLFAAQEKLFLDEARELYVADSSIPFFTHVLKLRQGKLTDYLPLISRILELKSLLSEPQDAAKADAYTFNPLLNKAIGSSIRCFGPKEILSLSPMSLLQVPLTELRYASLARTWWLPLLQNELRRCDALFFTSHLLPLASQLSEASANSLVKGQNVEAKKYELLCEQIWSLLPSLLHSPLDMPLLFNVPIFTKTLITALQSSTVREYACLAIRNMCQFAECSSKNVSTPLDAALVSLPFHKDENLPLEEHVDSLIVRVIGAPTRETLAKSNGLLSQLCSIYFSLSKDNFAEKSLSSETSRHCQLVLDTIKRLAYHIDKTLLDSRLEQVSAKLMESVIRLSSEESASSTDREADIHNSTAYADLLDLFVPYCSEKKLQAITVVSIPLLSLPANDARSLQRRGYKILKHILERLESENKIQSVSELEGLWTKLFEAKQMALPSSYESRLVCIKGFLRLFRTSIQSATLQNSLSEADLQKYIQLRSHVAKNLIGEILFRTTELSREVRYEALSCLGVLCLVCSDCMNDVVIILLAGLAGSSREIKAASLTCLARAFVEFSSEVSYDYLINTIDTALLLLMDNDKFVLKGAIRFALVAIRILPIPQLQERLPRIFTILDNPTSKDIRLKIRRIMERLIKKLGKDVLSNYLPAVHASLLTYVLRSIRRKEKLKVKPVKSDDVSTMGDDNESASSDGENAKKMHEKDEQDEKDDYFSDDSDSETEKPNPFITVGEGKDYDIDADESGKKKIVRKAKEIELGDDETRSRGIERDSGRKRSRSEWIVEKKDEPLDLFGEDAALGVLTQQYEKRKIRRSQNEKGEVVKKDVCYAPDGRMIISVPSALEKNSAMSEQQRKMLLQTAENAANAFAQPTSNGPKKGFLQASADKMKEKMKENRVLGKKERKHEEAKEKRKQGHFIMHSGDQYKSKKGGGDIPANKKVAPVAYLKLNPKLMKEKYNKASMDSLKSVMHQKKKK